MARKVVRPRVVNCKCIELENVRWNAQIIARAGFHAQYERERAA